MKNLVVLISVLFASFSIFENCYSEDWKGKTQTTPLEVGTMAGGSLYGTSANWTWLGTAAFLVLPHGFVEDLDDRVWAEVELGPTFFSEGSGSQTGLQYSAHVRWDFTRDESWTFYGLGGIGGFYPPKTLGGLTVAPRFGVGAEFQTKISMLFRVELSHEFFGAGVVFNF